MATRRAVAADLNGIVSCISDMWTYLRNRGVLDERAVVTRQDLIQWADEGYLAWVFENNQGRIDAVCIYRVESLVAPESSQEEKWMDIRILAVRPSAIATRQERERHLIRGLGQAVLEGSEQLGAVGVTCTYPENWQDLTDFLQRWNATFEQLPGFIRFWSRNTPGLPNMRSAITQAG